MFKMHKVNLSSYSIMLQWKTCMYICMPIYAQSTLPATLWQAKIDIAHMGIHLYMFVKIQKIMDFQQSHGPPIIIQHSGAIEDMHVYMYAHICSICFCQPPCGKHKYIKHIWAYIYKGMHSYRLASK